MNTDGSGLRLASEEATRENGLSITEEYIYFIDESGHISRTGLDGKGKEISCMDEAENINRINEFDTINLMEVLMYVWNNKETDTDV